VFASVAVPELLFMGDPAGVITKDHPGFAFGNLALLA